MLFYGWVVVSVGVTAMFAATFTGGAGFSNLIQPMARDLQWPRTLLAAGLSVGTLTGALVAPFFGSLADRFGARLVLTLCGVGIGISLSFVSTVTEPLPFLIAFGLARAIDMGALNVAVSTSVSNWFVRQRGRALGIAMAGNAIGVVCPFRRRSSALQPGGDCLAHSGGGTGLPLAVSAAIFLRRKPEDMGLLPDGDSARQFRAAEVSASKDPGWTVNQAAHSRAFWLLVIANALDRQRSLDLPSIRRHCSNQMESRRPWQRLP